MADNYQKFLELRKKYKKIVFEKYIINDSPDSLSFEYYFNIGDLSDFKTKWNIKKVNKNIKYDTALLNELIFSLGMVELISYLKMTCSEDIEVLCHALSIEQINWWKKLCINGLSEFFYTNNIKVENDIFHFNSKSDITYHPISGAQFLSKNDVLIPIGGGKDSAVSIELLKNRYNCYAYIINKRKATIDTFEKSKIDNDKLILADRHLDEKIIKYNSEGFLNGHTPFSAIVAFSSVIAAYINGIRHVALSNESSANESTVRGLNVNHQYSKTYEFECDFREYEKKYIDSGVNYFSLLRPLTEVGIARLFSKYTDYHMIFRSCNAGSKEDEWCAKCAKCLFVYIILSPFISKDKMSEIFGCDMLDDMSLVDIFDKLIGVKPEKPFECVGSREEVNASLQYLCKKIDDNNMPSLLKHYKSLNIGKVADIDTISKHFDENNNLSDEFIKIIKGALV